MSYSAAGIVQRSPSNKPVDLGSGVPGDLLLWSTAVWPNHLDYEHEIKTLAANPDHASDRWKGLKPEDRIGVALTMARFYGAPFAKQFVNIHNAVKVPGIFFQQVGPDTTPAQLTAKGFHFAGVQAQMNVEIWFHPSGDRLHRVTPHEPPKKESAPEMETPESEGRLEEDDDEGTGAPELADLTDGQRKAFALLQQMEHMNDEFKQLLAAQPPETQPFIEKEHQFRDLRKQFHQLFLNDDSISEPEFSPILLDRQEAVKQFVQLRDRAYGTSLGDWEQIEHQTR